MAGKSLKTTADIIQYATLQYDNGGSVIVELFDRQQLYGIIEEAARRSVSVRTVCKEIMSRVTTERTDTATAEGPTVIDRDGNALSCHERHGVVPPTASVVPPTASVRVRDQKQPPERKAIGDTSEATQEIVRKEAKAETDRVAVVTLTDNQRRFIAALVNEPFYTGTDSCIWIDCFLDTLEADDVMSRMAAGAMVSTLREKGVIVVAVGSQPTPSGHTRKSKYFKFTDVGLEVITNEKLLR